MGNSLFIGSLLGPLMLVLGISLVINTELYLKMIKDLLKEPIALFVSAMRGFVIGLIMIQNHNIWQMSWITIISVFGRIIFIKSIAILLRPTVFNNFAQKCKFSNKIIQVAGIIYALIGAFIIFKVIM
ncbi:MAG: hypothetical protein PHR68_03585 [Candidatus Gracilibacteria bacterium]|nr:hypothetical protein [Candidatus Gracilibacteria bacterium]